MGDRVAKEALFDGFADVDVVAYCRGPYCVFADDAVRLLRRRGRQARRLQDGYPEWHRAGLPVTTGPSQQDAGTRF
jgi:rhodanese-related sulfurtransferase